MTRNKSIDTCPHFAFIDQEELDSVNCIGVNLLDPLESPPASIHGLRIATSADAVLLDTHHELDRIRHCNPNAAGTLKRLAREANALAANFAAYHQIEVSDPGTLYAQAVHLAALAIRLATDGDQEFNRYQPAQARAQHVAERHAAHRPRTPAHE